MENAALNAIRPYLEPGESAVGTAIDMQHLAATPVGHEVTAQAEVTKVDGRQIEFQVSARDETRRNRPGHPSPHGDRPRPIQSSVSP